MELKNIFFSKSVSSKNKSRAFVQKWIKPLLDRTPSVIERFKQLSTVSALRKYLFLYQGEIRLNELSREIKRRFFLSFFLLGEFSVALGSA